MKCPECDAELNIPEDTAVGEIVSCSDCGADYEISKKDGNTIEIKDSRNRRRRLGRIVVKNLHSV